MSEGTPEELEAVELTARTHRWITDLAAAGMSEKTVMSAVLAALVERGLIHWGVDQTADWMRRMASTVERSGPALLVELYRQDR